MKRFIATGSDAFSSYWKEGEGDFLRSLLSDAIDLKTAQEMVPLFNQVDEVGDSVALEYLFDHSLYEGLDRLIKDLKSPLKATASDSFVSFYEQFHNVPEWVDFSMIEAGALFSNRGGTASLSVLRNYSLMGGYESSALIKPLIFSGALKKGAVKRLASTVDFWIHVTSLDALRIGGKGWESCIRTRMIHSYSRIMILKHSAWKSEDYGKPLNYWDMQATYLGFSIVFIDGLRKFGFVPNKQESAGTLKLWNYVSYLLGVPNTYLPKDEGDAVDYLYLWSRTQKGADADSKALAKSLYEEPTNVSFEKNKLRIRFVKAVNLAMNQHLLGTESMNKLDLPKSKMSWIIPFFIFMNKRMDAKAKRSKELYDQVASKGYAIQTSVRDLYLSELK